MVHEDVMIPLIDEEHLRGFIAPMLVAQLTRTGAQQRCVNSAIPAGPKCLLTLLLSHDMMISKYV